MVTNKDIIRMNKVRNMTKEFLDKKELEYYKNKDKETEKRIKEIVKDINSRKTYYEKASKSEKNKGCEDLNPKNVNDGRTSSIDNAFQRGDTLRTNTHPTVKPIKLMEYLVKLITRKDGIVLDPFMGSGTTAVACAKNGYEFIGFEKEKEYIEIINARLKPILEQTRLYELQKNI